MVGLQGFLDTLLAFIHSFSIFGDGRSKEHLAWCCRHLVLNNFHGKGRFPLPVQRFDVVFTRPRMMSR